MDLCLRERKEELEKTLLSAGATLAAQSLGRQTAEEECPIRTCFQRDVDRITYSKAFRRLKHKTQVFLSPEGDHYRTRLTHTLEVSRIARTIANALGLNEPLTEAIAMGHDLGHTPFGHAGERVLNQIVPGGFSHSEQSLRVVTRLEKSGTGLNLTREVNNGIVCHSGDGEDAFTLEGRIVSLADRIAYINHDIDDAMRAGVLKDIPSEISKVLGNSLSERINTLVLDVVQNSFNSDTIKMSPEIDKSMNDLRRFLFDEVYLNPIAKSEETKAWDLLVRLYEYYLKNPGTVSPDCLCHAEEDGIPRIVCDYIAGMTDRYAVARFSDIFIPKGWGKV